jgi:hypothetical protein
VQNNRARCVEAHDAAHILAEIDAEHGYLSMAVKIRA